MIIRRLGENLRSQNWFAVAVDLFIVILGVYLGLQAQSWFEAQQDKARAHFYAEGLAADFKALRSELTRCLQVNEDGLAAVSLIAGLTADGEPNVDSRNRGEIGRALLLMSGGNIPAGRATSFLEMQSAGELHLLADAELRRALTKYDQMAQAHRESWRSLRNEVSAYLTPLYAHVEVSIEVKDFLASRIDEFDAHALANDPGLRPMLNAVKGAKANEHELCKRQLAQAERVLQSLP